jgi:hypothetical protein
MRRIVHTTFFFFTHDHFIDLKVETMQCTIFGYKKESKIQPEIFWSTTPKLRVVSFTIFDLWPFYQARSWKTQNTVFGYKKGSKMQSDKIVRSATLNLWVVSFAIFDSWPFYQAKAEKRKIPFLVTKGDQNPIWELFLVHSPQIVSFATFVS